MKLLLVYSKSTQELFNRQSALGSYMKCLCELLENGGIEVWINGVSFKELKRQNVIFKSIAVAKNGSWKKFIPAFIKEFLKDVRVFKSMDKLFDSIPKTSTYDCILEFYNYGSDVGYRIAKQQRIPLLVVFDAPVLEEYMFFHGKKYFNKSKIVDRQLRTLKAAKKIVVYSNPVKEYLNKLTGLNLNTVIHQNVDFTRFEFLKKKQSGEYIKIGFIGSFLKWHRVDMLIHAFNKLRDHNYPVQLFLIGNGMEFHAVKQLAEHSKYREDIKMTGFLDGKELNDIKEELHIGVMPGSNWYGAPNKIFEYGAAGMAVIAPRTPTIADLFGNEKEVLLFEQDNEEALYQCLKRVCDDKALREHLADTLQRFIRNTYSEEKTADFYNKLIRETSSAIFKN